MADAKHTDRDEVEQVRIQFEQVGGHVVGAVLSNAVSSRYVTLTSLAARR